MSPSNKTDAQRQKLRKEAVARAWAHPVRVKAFRLLADGVYSPVEIADLIGEPVQNVGYHVHQLEAFGLVELVGERPVRGAVQHFYRAIARPAMDDDEWAALSLEEREPLSRETVQLIFGDAVEAEEAGTLDSRIDRHLCRVPMQVDEPGWRELHAIHEEMLERVLAVAGNVAQRQADESAKTFPVVSSMLCFERPRQGPGQ